MGVQTFPHATHTKGGCCSMKSLVVYMSVPQYVEFFFVFKGGNMVQNGLDFTQLWAK